MNTLTLAIVRTSIALALCATQSLAQPTYEPSAFFTLAGGGGYTTNVAGSAARFNLPFGLTVDSASNVYVADGWNGTIRKVTPAGEVTTLAGLPGSFGSVDGTGSAARFSIIQGLAVDSTGNVYVADVDYHTIRKVTPDGVTTTIAGVAGSFGSANGIGSAARFNSPFGAAVDSAGNVYVSDAGNSTIRKLTPAGTNWVVSTLAGLAGSFASADGTGSGARFNFPQDLAVDSAGNVYVADTDNHTIRKVTPTGVVTTIGGLAGVLGAVDGTNKVTRFSEPKGLAVDNAGSVYVADNDYNTIRKMTLAGTNWVVTTLAGRSDPYGGRVDGTGTNARFSTPLDVTVDGAGNLYVADGGNNLIRKVVPQGTNWVVTTLAGLGGNYGSTEERGQNARFAGPSGIAVDSAGNVYVADQINSTIRRISPNQDVTTLAGLAGYEGSANGTNSDARFALPHGIAVDRSGNLYVADSWANTLRKVTPTGTNWVVTTLAGRVEPLGNGGSEDGTGSAARFFHPKGVAVDGAGNVYVADALNGTIRKVTPAGVVTTFAGSAGFFGTANGTGSAARFNFPTSVAVDSTTNIYVADTWNHTIRKVTPARVVTTLAGMPGNAGSTDGTGNAARFNYPSGVAADSTGNIYVADTYNNTIRKVTPAGVVTTLGGEAGFFGAVDGTETTTRFGNPSAVTVDSEGNLYVADFYFNTIRRGIVTTRLVNYGLANGLFRFSIDGPSGHTFILEDSSDLVNWLPIWTNFYYRTTLGHSSGVISNRFFRARIPWPQ